jgi:hypothetical protein
MEYERTTIAVSHLSRRRGYPPRRHERPVLKLPHAHVIVRELIH